jgi:16S rRNA (guanine527-N7)-methyltransferase
MHTHSFRRELRNVNDLSDTQPISLQVAAAAAAIGVTLEPDQIVLFLAYLDTISIWNEKINLVSIKSSRDIPIKHFADSLVPLQFLPDPSARLLDIGSGGGFPGIPLKIASPSLQVTLLEASRRRSSFLKHVVRTLHLQKVEVVNRRVESCLKTEAFRQGFDVVISRAVFKLSELMNYAGYFLADQGLLIAMKGPEVRDEVADAEPARVSASLVRIASHDFRLPVTGDPRKILIYKKQR